MQWQEPTFFSLRISTRFDWIVRGAMWLAFTGGFLLLISMQFGAGRQWEAMDFIASTAVGLLAVCFVESRGWCRVFSIDHEEVAFVNHGAFMWFGNWKFRDLSRAAVLGSNSTGKRFGLLILESKRGKRSVIGLPRGFDVDALCRHFARYGVETTGDVTLAPTNRPLDESEMPSDATIRESGQVLPAIAKPGMARLQNDLPVWIARLLAVDIPGACVLILLAVFGYLKLARDRNVAPQGAVSVP